MKLFAGDDRRGPKPLPQDFRESIRQSLAQSGVLTVRSREIRNDYSRKERLVRFAMQLSDDTIRQPLKRLLPGRCYGSKEEEKRHGDLGQCPAQHRG